jgi:multiple sugar transport system substrate-binding protein
MIKYEHISDVLGGSDMTGWTVGATVAKAARWLTATLVAGLVAATAPARAVELSLWSPPFFTPGAGLPAMADAYRDLYARFEAENPGIRIRYEVIPGNVEALRHYLTAAGANNLPDVALLDASWVARLAQTGKLQALNDLWTAENRAKVLPDAVAMVTIDGRVYSVPFHTSLRALVYRRDTLASLGFEQPPASWDRFLAYAEAAKAKGLHAIMYPGHGSAHTMLHMLSMFWGLGGELVDEAGRPVFFEGRSREVLETVYATYRMLIEKGYMPASVGTMDETGLRPFFYSGENAMSAQSTSSLQQIYADRPPLQGNLGIMSHPMPGDAKAKPVLGGWTYGIFASAPDRKQAAWKFVEFVTRPENLGRLNVVHGHLPVLQAIWDQEPYRSDPLMVATRRILETHGMRPLPTAPIYPAIAAAWSQQMADVLSGRTTPARAVENARNQVQAEFRRISNR